MALSATARVCLAGGVRLSTRFQRAYYSDRAAVAIVDLKAMIWCRGSNSTGQTLAQTVCVRLACSAGSPRFHQPAHNARGSTVQGSVTRAGLTIQLRCIMNELRAGQRAHPNGD